MMSTGTAPDVFGAAFLACAVEAIAATTMALDAGTARDFAIRWPRCERRTQAASMSTQTPTSMWLNSYSLDADMVPV